MLSLSCYIRMCWTFGTYREEATFLDSDALASYRHKVFLIRQDCVWGGSLGEDALAARRFLCWSYNPGKRKRGVICYVSEQMTQRQRVR